MLLFLLLIFGAGPGDSAWLPDATRGGKYIIGGRDTNITEVPYTASLWRNDQFSCGAVIISEKFLLTAAHCIREVSPEILTLRIGSSYANRGGVVHKVKRAQAHPRTGNIPYDYDVGFIELQEPIKFNSNAKPIPVTDVEPEDGAHALISGFGRNGSYVLPDQLQSLETSVMGREKCKKEIENLPLSPRMICAFRRGKSAFRGDSGGPIVVDGKVVGAVSWALVRDITNHPTMFANLAEPKIRKFIKENTGV